MNSQSSDVITLSMASYKDCCECCMPLVLFPISVLRPIINFGSRSKVAMAISFDLLTLYRSIGVISRLSTSMLSTWSVPCSRAEFASSASSALLSLLDGVMILWGHWLPVLTVISFSASFYRSCITPRVDSLLSFLCR
jgi:hypothetical protein